MDGEKLTINGIDYVRADSVRPTETIGPTQIIVADRGWVFVGTVEDHPDGSVTITNCRNIRRWGTTKGLGELQDGPTANTTYDPYPATRCTPIIRMGVRNGW